MLVPHQGQSEAPLLAVPANNWLVKTAVSPFPHDWSLRIADVLAAVVAMKVMGDDGASLTKKVRLGPQSCLMKRHQGRVPDQKASDVRS
jgi:hypothetical protein